MFHFYAVLVVLAFVFLNRLRGGGFVTLPIDSRLAVAPLVGLVGWLSGVHSDIPSPEFKTAVDGILFGLAWYVWALPPWSPWMALGHAGPSGRPLTWFEREINSISLGNVYFGLFWRMTICLVPMALLFGAVFIGLGAALVGSYALGWAIMLRFNPFGNGDGIEISELIAGAAWGLFTVASIAL